MKKSVKITLCILIGLFILPTRAFCQTGKVSILADTNDFNTASVKMLTFCDVAEKDLPVFQTAGVETVKNTLSNGRYLVTATAVSPMVIHVTFIDKAKERRVIIMFAKEDKSLFDRFNIFHSPKDSARELAGYWIAEIYK
jgi:hypothetical protein